MRPHGYRPRRAVRFDAYRVRTDDPTAREWKNRQVRIVATEQKGVRLIEAADSTGTKAYLITPEYAENPAGATLRVTAEAAGHKIIIGRLGG